MFGPYPYLLLQNKNYESTEKDGDRHHRQIKRKNHKTSDKFQDDINYQKIHNHHHSEIPSQNPLGSILNINKGT